MLFYLGTHHANWLSEIDIPFFVSRNSLRGYKTLPRAQGAWALDSGAFTELQNYGEWTMSTWAYAFSAQRYATEIGHLSWASPQDWMCEPFMLKKTGLTVAEHQRLTVENVIELRSYTDMVHFIPVLQGWVPDDYLRCWEMYEQAGVHLEDEPVVGVGSVCRRQGKLEALEILEGLMPLKLHGFGVKLQGVERLAPLLVSSDSMAWSFRARRSEPLPGHTHRNCANCLEFALIWRSRVLGRVAAVNGGRLSSTSR